MSDFRVKGTDLTSVANAIRTKGGTSASLSFPDEFVEAIEDIPTGGGSTLITKSITANGTYNASSDNADGYSSVTVAVPSKLVTGTFTGTTAGSAMDVSLPYTGDGYQIAFQIYPTGGTYKDGSTFYDKVQKDAVDTVMGVKADIATPPNYNSTNVTENSYTVVNVRKSSTSSATVYTDAYDVTAKAAGNYPANNGTTTCVRFKGKSTMSVYISGGSDVGFAKDIEYTYQIVYSA